MCRSDPGGRGGHGGRAGDDYDLQMVAPWSEASARKQFRYITSEFYFAQLLHFLANQDFDPLARGKCEIAKKP